MSSPADVFAWILERLAAQPNLQVFPGAPDDADPSLGYAAPSRDVAIDPDGRAHMYAAVYPGTGWRDPLGDALCDTVAGPTELTFQVTAAGGDPERCLRAAAKVAAALDRQTAPGGGVVRLYDPGQTRIDRDPSPSRTYLPILGTVLIP